MLEGTLFKLNKNNMLYIIFVFLLNVATTKVMREKDPRLRIRKKKEAGDRTHDPCFTPWGLLNGVHLHLCTNITNIFK